MPSTSLHRLFADYSLPMLPTVRRDSQQVWVSAGRAQRIPNGHRIVVELERLLLSKRQQVAGGRLFDRSSINCCGSSGENLQGRAMKLLATSI